MKLLRKGTLFVFIALCSLIYSCNGKDPIANNDYTVIDLDKTPRQEKEYLSSFFKEAGVIVLETTENSLLNRIERMEVLDDHIYILDVKGGLFVFNKQGKFLRKIGNEGTGPGEYVFPSDLTIDAQGKKIYLLDSQAQTVLKYSTDGTFEGALKLENKGTTSHRIQYFNNKLYADLYNPEHPEECFLLSEVDINTGQRTSLLFDASRYNKGWNELVFTEQRCFIPQPAGELKYMEIFMDTIYKIDKENIYPYLVLKSEDLITKEFIDAKLENISAAEGYSEITSADKVCNIKKYFETGKFIYFEYSKNNSGYTLIHNKAEGTSHITQCVINDVLYSDGAEYLSPRFNAFDKNKVYSIEMETDYSRKLFYKNMEEKKINAKVNGIDKLDELKEDSNPIIVYYTFDD